LKTDLIENTWALIVKGLPYLELWKFNFKSKSNVSIYNVAIQIISFFFFFKQLLRTIIMGSL
jgi:hypothetical protein